MTRFASIFSWEAQLTEAGLGGSARGVEEADGATAVAGALKDVHAEGALEQRRPVERVLRGTVPPPAENGRSGVSDGAPARAGAAPASSRGFGLATLPAAPARARPGTRASSTRAVARRLERQGETTFGRSDTGAAGDAFRSSRTVSTDDNSSAQVARATFTTAALRAALDGSFLESRPGPFFESAQDSAGWCSRTLAQLPAASTGSWETLDCASHFVGRDEVPLVALVTRLRTRPATTRLARRGGSTATVGRRRLALSLRKASLESRDCLLLSLDGALLLLDDRRLALDQRLQPRDAIFERRHASAEITLGDQCRSPVNAYVPVDVFLWAPGDLRINISSPPSPTLSVPVVP